MLIRFTKSERKELRKLAEIAYERELGAALKSLYKEFKKWEKNAATPFELSDHIHKFHNGILKDLWVFYTNAHNDVAVARAIANGLVLKAEISASILEKSDELQNILKRGESNEEQNS